ncbi:DUF2971 domain-containing protein [Parahaliea aestuarii]|uniref:DUF2971 domain-containing protein n=1 Tax=Parahaliea aestuarii TaxID=1852021 RepID=A0A5C8ZV18_9GAMM|nr:DUF2971 domain-containing protein [Parahaliea aestuarii]TXS92363.1 DUF2971 domain-containing protein [Parahaliea aestuarii]
MIDSIIQRLYAEEPRDTLYHYTSLSGLMGIIHSGHLRASDIRYMNDSAEIRHTLDLMGDHISRRVIAGTDRPVLLNQLSDWLNHRIVGGPMLFGASFRANGNLLSQWRGYSVHGKGVSLGFAPQHILACARQQHFQVGRCIYDPQRQAELIEEVVDGVEAYAAASDNSDSDEAANLRIFERIEGRLLRLAALLKHPAFEEEQEWRIVSPVIADNIAAPVHFREGISMLVPWYAFELQVPPETGDMGLNHVYLGPTSNIDLSMNSLKLFLDQRGLTPKQGISYCQIPYRQR